MNTASTKVIEAARELLRAGGYFVDILWHVDDIHFICEEYDLPKLSQTEAMEVFSIVRQQFDGERGLSWPQLEIAVKIYFLRRAAQPAVRSESHSA